MPQTFSAQRLKKIDYLVFGVLQSLVLLAGLGFLIFSVQHYLVSDRVFGNDLSSLWAAAKIASTEDLEFAYSGKLFALEGVRPQLEIPADFHVSFYYPPHTLLFLWPLRPLSYPLAVLLWTLTSPLILAAVVWAVFQRSWYAAGFAVVAPAAVFSFWIGQTGMLAAALLIGGMGCLERRPILAGLLFGLLTFKPILGVLIPFALLAGGHRRAFASAFLTFAALVLLSIAIYDVGAWISYFTSVSGEYFGMMAYAQGPQTLVRLFEPTVFLAARNLGFDTVVSLGVQGCVGAVVLACVVWAFYCRKHLGLSSALLFTGSWLVTPLGHSYDMSAVTVAVFLLLQDSAARGERRGEHFVALMAWLLPVLIFALNGVGVPIGPLILGLLFGVLMRRLVQRDQPEKAPGPVDTNLIHVPMFSLSRDGP